MAWSISNCLHQTTPSSHPLPLAEFVPVAESNVPSPRDVTYSFPHTQVHGQSSHQKLKSAARTLLDGMQEERLSLSSSSSSSFSQRQLQSLTHLPDALISRLHDRGQAAFATLACSSLFVNVLHYRLHPDASEHDAKRAAECGHSHPYFTPSPRQQLPSSSRLRHVDAIHFTLPPPLCTMYPSPEQDKPLLELFSADQVLRSTLLKLCSTIVTVASLPSPSPSSASSTSSPVSTGVITTTYHGMAEQSSSALVRAAFVSAYTSLAEDEARAEAKGEMPAWMTITQVRLIGHDDGLGVVVCKLC